MTVNDEHEKAARAVDEALAQRQIEIDERTAANAQELESKPAKAQVPAIPNIPVRENGVLVPREIGDLIYLSQLYHKSQAFSKSFASPQAIFVALQMSVEMGISPSKALNCMYVVNGRVNLHSGGPLGLVLASGKCESYREWLIDKDYREVCLENKNLDAELLAGVCTTKRHDQPEPMTTYFTVNDAKRAELLGKDNWKRYVGRMLLSKARNHNLEYNFADILGGLGDDDGRRPGGPDATDEAKASDMNKALNGMVEKREKAKKEAPKLEEKGV